MKVFNVVIFFTANIFTSFSFHLNILHTNDIRSHFEMFNTKTQSCDMKTQDQNVAATRCYGGVGRRSGFIRRFRRDHDNVLLLDAGGQYLGTMWYLVFQGKLSRYFLDYMEYDAITLGTHDFDLGLAGLDPLLNSSKYQIVSSNIVKDSKTTVLINNSVNSHIVLNINNRSIGIIGYVTPITMTVSSTDNLTINNEIPSLKPEIQALKDKGVNIIIALGHSGLDEDKMIASRLRDIDIIVGGFSKSLLYNGENREGDVVEGEYPIVYNHNNSQRTLIVHAGNSGKYMGVLRVEFDSRGQVTNWTGNPVPLNSSVPVDQRLVDYLKSHEPEFKTYFRVVVGSTKVDLSTENQICRKTECLMGNMHTDALLYYMRRTNKWPNLTLTIINGGLFKDSLKKGNISFGDVLSVFPLRNQMLIITTNGSSLLQAFEHSVVNFSLPWSHGKYLQVSGFKVKYNMTKENYNRVVSVKTKRCYECSEYDDIIRDKKYEVITNSFIGKGGDGYDMFKGSKQRVIDVRDLEVALIYLKEFSPISKGLEKRISGMETFPGWDKEFKSRATRKGQMFILIIILFILES